ncbi:PREDICTED: dimethyladenosine transferase 2, mitochondrial [Hipposideros armiger]|uniref:rRNA adenine N(6)-methyltransferase n=1 Tax=Hipposideros armiger TaxID=186990 RepID=A0A8B7SQI6_HIPAR|nr:PREDICTED: dimethyladenosine transferase 2, mitochondrial [Hipposideros armiger]
MWAPVAGLPPRLTLSAFSGAGRFCVLRHRAARWKDVPARNSRGLSDFHPQLLPSQGFGDSPSWLSKCRFEARHYLINPKLAETVVQILWDKQDACKVFLECNPGPGILTQALIERGARVIALESDRTFIPHLESLGKNLDGKLDVVHCDFFKLDPRSHGVVKPPSVTSQLLFQNLGIEALPWSRGIPLKVVGIFPTKNGRKTLWKLLHDIYSCTSIYRYGRVELNLFINEKECQKLMANPQTPRLYQALSVLWQVACEVELLHVEPWSSFDIYTQSGQLEKPKCKESLEEMKQNLCFIRLTPRRNLFTENLTPVNYDVFFHMLKQCFMKRNAKLIDHLCSLSPVDAMDILKQIRKKEKTKITNMYPRDFKHLFETIECSKGYTCKWLYDDFMEDIIT